MTTNPTFPPERDFPPARLAQRRDQLVSLIEAGRHAPAARRPAHRRRWAAVAVALATAVAVTLAVTLSGPAHPTKPVVADPYVQMPPRVSTTDRGGAQQVALVLRRAARTAAKRPAITPVSGEFIYTKTEAVYENVDEGQDGPIATALQPQTIESWILPDGRGHYDESDGHLVFPTAADADYFDAHYPERLINAHTAVQYFGKGAPNYNTVSQLPTDPAQLEQALEDRTVEGGPPGDFETFQIIGDLLRWTAAPPAVRSALYTVASELPGVVLLGSTQDRLGRPGIGVAYDQGGVRYELIFDPQTSGLLGEQTVVLEQSTDHPFPPGSVTDWAAYVASGIVDSNTATTSAAP